MTDDYTALIERLNEHALGLESAAYLLKGAALDDMRRETATVHEAAAALRAQAQTIERLTEENRELDAANKQHFDRAKQMYDELEAMASRMYVAASTITRLEQEVQGEKNTREQIQAMFDQTYESLQQYVKEVARLRASQTPNPQTGDSR